LLWDVAEMSKKDQASPLFDWAFLFYWLMATTSGWFLGWLLLPAIALVTAGVGVGVMQGFALYRRIPKSWRWILATAAGWMAGLVIIIPIVPAGMGLLSGLVTGATMGTAQWLLLRREVHWGGWWIIVSALAWSLALSLAPPSGLDLLPRIVLSGVVPGVMTGLTLELLLQHPKAAELQVDDD
jgi:hypothetical protein